MIEVDYYYSSSKKWFIDFAESLSKATGENVRIENNHLVFPPTLAEGRYEFYELTDGIAVLLTDCSFFKELKLHRRAVAGNDHYKVLFNISNVPVILSKQSGRIVNLSSSFAEAILFSSHSTEVSFFPGVNQRMRTVQLIFHRSWALNHLMKNIIPLSVSRMQRFANYSPMQFTTNLDLKSYDLVEEMLSDTVPSYTAANYLEGCAIQLMALFFNSVIDEELGEERIVSDDAMRIIQLKENIEVNIEEPIPTMDEAAKVCLMSRTRFAVMFKSLYDNNYATYFLELRMTKAAELLSEGNSVTDVGHKIGYSNIGHFAKVFKEHFGVTPKLYQKDVAD
jgi:AraC-like DNA-binding protein